MRHLAFVIFAFVSFSSWSDESVREEDRVMFEKKTVIDFSDYLIRGDFIKPEGSYLKNRKRTKFTPLIELRSNFRPELMRTIDDL